VPKRVLSPAAAFLFIRMTATWGETMKKGWQFLSLRWWVVHFLGFALVYTAGRLTAALMKG
jgi:ABC-type dipeptide/oligopeptide/nickel transport system permease subunit